MAKDLSEISKNLGKSLELLRRKRGLTQVQLAKLAGLPRSTLTNLESGEGNPSLNNLAKLAAALQVSIEELLARPRASCKLIRALDMPLQKRAHGTALIYKLLPDAIPGMEMDRMEIDGGVRMGGVPHLGGTKEYCTLAQGEISVSIAGETYKLGVGDVFAFPGDQAHSYHNTGTKKAVLFSVVVLAPVNV
jgi:transcriptional regulator with XRE-family HTH domain